MVNKIETSVSSPSLLERGTYNLFILSSESVGYLFAVLLLERDVALLGLCSGAGAAGSERERHGVGQRPGQRTAQASGDRRGESPAAGQGASLEQFSTP